MTDRPNLREETISSERFYFGRILDLEVDRVLPPSSAEAEREVIRHLGADVVLPLNEE